MIRFDSNSSTLSPPLSPTETVVVLHVEQNDPKTITFNAVTEDRLWRDQHARNVYSWSPCLSSSGTVTVGPDGWHATLAAPAVRP